MKLKIKFLKWSAGLPVVMLHNETASKLRVHTKGRVSLRTFENPAKEISTPIDTIRNHLVGKKEVAVTSEIRERLNLKRGQIVDVNLTDPPE